MPEKITLLLDDPADQALSGAFSEIVTRMSLAFGRSFSLQLRTCEKGQEDLSSAVFDLCSASSAVFCASRGMRCTEALQDELLCTARLCVIPRRSASVWKEDGAEQGFLFLLSPLSSEASDLGATAALCLRQMDFSRQPLWAVAASGHLKDIWSHTLSALPDVHLIALADALPLALSAAPPYSVLLSPPFAAGVLEPAFTAAFSAFCSGFALVAGGQLPLYTLLNSRVEDWPGGQLFALLNMLLHWLRTRAHLGADADCLEAAMMNVLGVHKGAHPGQLDVQTICSLVCQQLEVAANWLR